MIPVPKNLSSLNILQLPEDLILMIVSAVVPEKCPVAFKQDHVVTRSLLSLSSVGKFLRPEALRQLYHHCLYIDSEDRLMKLMDSLRTTQVRGVHTIAEPQRKLLRWSLPSMYLDPKPSNFRNADYGVLVSVIQELFLRCGQSLSRLVFYNPLPGEAFDEALEATLPDARPVLSRAFLQVQGLKELTIVGGGLKAGFFWLKPRQWAIVDGNLPDQASLDRTPQLHPVSESASNSEPELRNPEEQQAFQMLFSCDRVAVIQTFRGFVEASFMCKSWSRTVKNNDTSLVTLKTSVENYVFRYDVPCREAWVKEHALDGSIWEEVGM